MTDRVGLYTAFKQTGDRWVPQIPTNWELRRLRHVIEMRVSNVDKHSDATEEQVRLCNYVDAYKNERITNRLNFMRATASTDEVNRFRLRIGDVLITKDSETWDDIGVPALVEYEAPDLICGYHLALLRSRAQFLSGDFLLRALQTPSTKYQFHVSANGVTRYGLSHNAIKSILIPIPSPEEQAAIVRFMDYYDRLILCYIAVKRKLIALLNEQKHVIIQRAVTCGLDSNVRIRHSGVDWLGAIPSHWSVMRAKYLFREIDHRSDAGTEPLLSLRMHKGLVPHNDVSSKRIEAHSLIGFKKVETGQLVMNRMRAAIGLFGISPQSGLVSPDYAVFEPIGSTIAEYYLHLFKTPLLAAVFRQESKGLGTGSSGFMRLYTDRFGNINLPFPPVEEQRAIVSWIAQKTANLLRATETVHDQLSKLKEFRERLLSDVLTGEVDVREAVGNLPPPPEYPANPDLKDSFLPDGAMPEDNFLTEPLMKNHAD